MNSLKSLYLLVILTSIFFQTSVSAQDEYQQYPQQYPNYNQPTNPYGQPDENHSAKSPFKLEIAKMEASVYRQGEEPLPLSQVPRLNQGDVLKVKIANEAVNGIMPHQSKWDWTLLVAFINPSRNNSTEETLSQEIRLRESGWYNDNFFTVPYDSQPMIFLYPKPKMRKKILGLIEKRPDDIRQMGEKVIEISSAYAHISSFLTQVQYMMANPTYGNGLLEQSIEGMARTFNIQMPSCWRSFSAYGGYSNYGYGNYDSYGSSYGNYSGSNNLAAKAQCLSRNVRIEDLNYSVGRMLAQGGLVALNQLRMSHPEISKWIALVAVAVDFFLKITNRTAIRIIPAVISTPENPIFVQNGYNSRTSYNPTGNYYQPNATSFAPANQTNSSKVSLLANYQPTDREFVTVYAYVPHKWQPEPDPKITDLYAPQMVAPCLHSGKNILRNTDLRVEWLTDTFTRDFKMILTDNENWTKEFPLRKNLGLNAWEVDFTKEDLAALPKKEGFFAKISGKRGFSGIESPMFTVPISNGINWEASIESVSSGKNMVTLKRTSGEAKCSQTIIYKSSGGQPVIFPITKENNILNISEDKSEIKFEIEKTNSQGITDTIQIQQFGGELLNVKLKP